MKENMGIRNVLKINLRCRNKTNRNGTKRTRVNSKRIMRPINCLI